MPDQETVDTERSVVTTYVPAYQKSTWEDHAAELDMSLSEFVRSMVQAGRHGFGGEVGEHKHVSKSGQSVDGSTGDSEDGHPQGSNPRGNVRKTVLQTLEDHGPMSGADIVDAVVENWRNEVQDALADLEQAGKIRRPPIENEFELVED